MSDPADPQVASNSHYRELVLAHGAAPAGAQMSEAGQRFRFERLLDVCDLNGLEVLDLGCGPGALFPHLDRRFPEAHYTGFDIVPEMAAAATAAHPRGTFLCGDLLAGGLAAEYDVVLSSALFNNARPDADLFLRKMISAAWTRCRRALAFNFISSYGSRRDHGMAYHDPAEILRFCAEGLSPRVSLAHHYERCDVAVFVYR